MGTPRPLARGCLATICQIQRYSPTQTRDFSALHISWNIVYQFYWVRVSPRWFYLKNCVLLEIHDMLLFKYGIVSTPRVQMMYNENVQRKISENYPLFISFSLLKLDQNIWIIDEIKNLKLKTLLFKLDEGKEKIIVKTNNQPFVNIIIWYLLNRSPQDRDLDISFDLYC